jgi:hypothetical protein
VGGASASTAPHARPPRGGGPARGRRVRGGSRSPPDVVVVPPAGRRRPGSRRGGRPLRRRDRGAPGQAHGPPARRSRPASRAPAWPCCQSGSLPASCSSAAADEGREPTARDGLRARARAPRAAAASSTTTTSGSAAGTATAGSAGRCHEAVEPAGTVAAAPGAEVVGRVAVPAALVVVAEAAQAGPVLRVPDGGGDRGGHLRADRRPAAAAAPEAAARRAAAARCKANSRNCPSSRTNLLINLFIIKSVQFRCYFITRSIRFELCLSLLISRIY